MKKYLEQGDSIFSSSYREFELSRVRVIGIYTVCIYKYIPYR